MFSLFSSFNSLPHQNTIKNTKRISNYLPTIFTNTNCTTNEICFFIYFSFAFPLSAIIRWTKWIGKKKKSIKIYNTNSLGDKKKIYIYIENNIIGHTEPSRIQRTNLVSIISRHVYKQYKTKMLRTCVQPSSIRKKTCFYFYIFQIMLLHPHSIKASLSFRCEKKRYSFYSQERIYI